MPGGTHIPSLSVDYLNVKEGVLEDQNPTIHIQFFIPGSVATTDGSTTELDKIDSIPNDATSHIIVHVSCKSDDDARFGTWTDQLTISKNAGTVTIRKHLSISHHSSAQLKANDVTYTANGGDVDIDVSGIAATNIQWDSRYEIAVNSTN